MDELVRTRKLQFEKSVFFINIYKNEIGTEYIKIIQNIGNEIKKSILINPNNLDDIIKTLIDFKEEIALNQKIEDSFYIPEQVEIKIINFFLKGTKIKDLSLLFRYKEEKIRELLVKYNIEIIDGLNIKPINNWKFKRK